MQQSWKKGLGMALAAAVLLTALTAPAAAAPRGGPDGSWWSWVRVVWGWWVGGHTSWLKSGPAISPEGGPAPCTTCDHTDDGPTISPYG